MKKLSLTVLVIFFITSIVAFSLHKANNNLDGIMIEEELHDREDEDVQPEIVKDEYGIHCKGYDKLRGTVRPRQNLSILLSEFSIDHYTIHVISEEMSGVYSPSRIRAGNSYVGYFSKDSLEQLDYFIYDISPLTYLKIDLTDSIEVNLGEKETTKVTKESSGIINSSLWETMVDNDLAYELAISMSEILAWEVDFYRIEKGDRFKVVYDETYVNDSTSIGIDKIHGIYFLHRGRDIYGYNFQEDTIDGYFNEEGENLRKMFLQAPLKFYRITSGYSRSRLHPILGTRRPHLGTDYAAPAGTPILAVGDGVITIRSYTRGNGNYIRIRHNSVYETQYLHMSRFASGIRVGTRVEQGDVIGYVGSTGLATGPHVCFRFWKNGQQVNHRRLEFPSADPLPDEHLDDFSLIRDSLRQRLDEIKFKDKDIELIS